MPQVEFPSHVVRKNEAKLIQRNAEIDQKITPEALKEAVEKIRKQIHRTPSRVSMGLGSLFGQGKEVKEASSQVESVRKKIGNKE